MSGLLYCGICCMLISGWGIVQLAILGCLFFFEAPILFEEAMPEEYGDYDDFINKTKSNYRTVAFNCWFAAILYIITLVLSCMCIRKAKKKAARQALLMEDDEYVCKPPIPKPKNEKNIK